MATREENLKKINEELELLSDEQLEQVAGGNTRQTSEDSKFLNVLLHGRIGQCDRYGEWRIRWQNHDAEITRAWASVGVDAVIDSGKPCSNGSTNVYRINGNEVTRWDAWQHAMNVVGRHLEDRDWDW